jgi:MFS family permease
MIVTTPQNRNRAYALSSVLRGVGTLGGTIVGGLLPSLFVLLIGGTVEEPAPYRYALWVGALLAIGGIIPILRMSRPARTVERVQQADDTVGFPIWPMALLILHVYLGNSSSAICQNFCSAYMDTNLQLSTAAIGIITGAGQFVAMFSPLIAPRLAARFGNGWILMMTTLGAALSLLPLIYGVNWLGVNWFGAGIGRLGILALSAMWMPALQVYQMEMVASRWRSLAYGILSMGMSLTFTSVSIAGGYIATEWGYQPLFLLGMALSSAGSLLMWGMMRMRRLQPQAA